MHHTLTIVSAKYYSAAHCKNSWNFKPNAACPPSSGSSGPNQRVKVTRTDVKRTASSFTNHDTWLMQCGTRMPALELHCTATMEEKKKTGVLVTWTCHHLLAPVWAKVGKERCLWVLLEAEEESVSIGKRARLLVVWQHYIQFLPFEFNYFIQLIWFNNLIWKIISVKQS